MNNQEAIVHFEDKDLTASEWLKLVCDRSPLAEVLVRATGDQRYAASAIRDEDDRSDEDCQHCGRPFGDEVEIHQGKDRGKSGVRQMTDTTRELSVSDDGQALRLMGAEIMFYDDPRAMRDAMGELVARGFEVRPFDWRDPCGTETRWLLAWVTTPLDVAGFRKFVTDIVSPDGDVLQWGVIDSSDELAEWLAHDECCA
jgi:hypothetical protein